MVCIWIEESLIWTDLDASFECFVFAGRVGTCAFASSVGIVCVKLLGISGALRDASHGRVISILFIWGKSAVGLAGAVFLRVSIIIGCNADPIAHALIGVVAVLPDFSRTHLDADSGFAPLEARLNAVGKKTAG